MRKQVSFAEIPRSATAMIDRVPAQFMRKPRLLFALAVFAFSASTGWSAASESWLELRSPHFTVVTDTNEKQARHIADQFEHMRWVFQTLFPKANVDPAVSIVVIAVKDRKEFQALEPPAYLSRGQIDLAGSFLHGPDKNYILVRLDGQQEHPFAVVYHEYTHVLTSAAADWLPLWLNEGLAEFFQNTDIHDKYVDLGQPSANDILYLRQQPLLPLATLFKVDSTSPYYHEEQKGSVFYAESWALTQYLEVTDKQANKNRLGDYVDLMSKHQDPVTAAAQAFGDLKQLQRDLETYVTRGNYSFFRLTATTAIDPSSFQVKALKLPQANAFRADLLAYNQRTQEARALLDTVLRDDPNNTLAHETMGFLSFRAGDLASAQNWYQQAVQLDSQSYLAHYYFAAIAMQSAGNDNDAAVEASLREAIKLNSSFAPAYDRLAVFYGARHKQLDEAYRLSLRAILLDPAMVGYRINAANILVQENQYQSAINVLTAATKVARTPEETAAVQNRIREFTDDQVRHQEAAKANQQIATTTPVSATDAATHNSGVGALSPKHPAAPATGPKHTVTGIIRAVQCSYPAVIEFKVETAGKSVDLYSDNYFKVDFTTTNFTPKGKLHPCSDLEGFTALVKYAEVSDKTVDGQIASVELRK